MSTSRNQSSKGFTIIEVMIVMAIAGLLMMLVFMAIPTLLRNGRNDQRKQGATSILQALSHYELNNSGTMPAPCNAGSCFGATSFTANDKLIFYDGTSSTDVIVCVGSYSGVGCSPATAVTDTEKVYIYNYQRCSPTISGTGTSAGSGYNDSIALYALEGSHSATIPMCQQL